MQKTHNRKKKPQDRRQNRKMKPYCLTQEKARMPSFADNEGEVQDLDYPNVGRLKKSRKDFRDERRADNKWARNQGKVKIKKELS